MSISCKTSHAVSTFWAVQARPRVMKTLSSTTINLAIMMIAINQEEETQWWLANVINLWNKVTDAPYKISTITGCYSGEELPLVTTLTHPESY